MIVAMHTKQNRITWFFMMALAELAVMTVDNEMALVGCQQHLGPKYVQESYLGNDEWWEIFPWSISLSMTMVHACNW